MFNWWRKLAHLRHIRTERLLYQKRVFECFHEVLDYALIK